MATTPNRRRRRLPAALSAVVAAGALAPLLVAQAPVPVGLPARSAESLQLDPRRLDAAEALLDQFVAEHKIAGAVAVVARRGYTARVMTAGVQDLATRAPMSERSIFRIYSMTKAVTAVAAMMLEEEGRFALGDPVSKYLPEFGNVMVETAAGAPRAPSRPITVRDLLLHTSGLNHRTSDEYQRARVRNRVDTMAQFLSNVVRVPLKEDPGTRFRYSEATTVVGRLIEVWSGQPLDRFFAGRIFAPLGMVDTTFAVTSDQRPRLTTAYAPQPAGGLVAIDTETLPFTQTPALLEGAVGLVSTVPDYLRFSQMLLNKGQLDGKRLLKASTVERMVTNGLSGDLVATRRSGMGWGLANVDVAIDPARVRYPTARGEYGWDGTAGTVFWVDPSRELITILMTQVQPYNPDRLHQQFKTLVEAAVLN
jgi:CubicO group peptidase (beta-lactamase class C family)